jgi:hypothetical protein
MPKSSDNSDEIASTNPPLQQPIYASTEPPAPLIDIPPYDETSAKALIGRLRALKNSGIIEQFSAFAKEAGVTFGQDPKSDTYAQRLSHWMSHPKAELTAFGEHNYRRLSTHLQTQFQFLPSNIDVTMQQLLRYPLYHAIASQLNCSERAFAHKTARKQMVGSYLVYRPSKRAINFGYVGRMDISYDEKLDAFPLREQYARSHDERWDMAGALYPITDDVAKLLTINRENQTLQVKYANDFPKGEQACITRFSGWMSHIPRLRAQPRKSACGAGRDGFCSTA